MPRRPAGLFQALVVLLVMLSALHTPVQADTTCAQYAELAGYGVIGHAGFTYGNNSIINDNDITGSIGNTPTPSGQVDNVSLTFPPIEPASFPGGGSDVSDRDSLAPGTYGTVTVKTNQTFFLSPGDYFIDEFDIGNKVELVIQPPGQVRLYIGSELKAGNEFELNSSGATGDLLLFLYGGASFTAGNANLGDSDLDFNGLLYSPYPDTHIEFGNNNEIRGAILSAGTLDVGNNTLFDYNAAVQQTVLDKVGCAAEARPHHIRIEHDGSGLTCAPETVSVRACADPDCQTPYTDDLSGQITGGDTAAGFVIPAGDSASVSVRKTTPGPTTLATSGLSPAPTSSPETRCFVGASETCSMDFSDAGFIFDVPTLTAGKPSAAVTLSAVKIADTGIGCAPGITGERTVKFWSSYDNPATGSSPVSVNGQLIDTAAPGTGLTLQFNAEAQAQLIVSYADVGRLRLDARYDGTGEDAGLVLLGNDDFVVKPHRFEISAITCGDGTVNPAADTAAGGKFCKAGEEFTLEVKAVNTQGAPTPNFGEETPPESVMVTSEPVSGLGLTNTPPPSYSFAVFGKKCDGEDESATACGTLVWSEVGIIRLTPSMADGDYLGAGDVTGQTSGNIGRFYPHHFTIGPLLLGDALIDRADINDGDEEECSSNFSYLDEEFKTRFQLTARNADEGVTQNYSGAFAKFPLSNWSAYGFAASGLPAGLSLESGSQTPTGAWTAGAADITALHKVSRPADGSLAPPAEAVSILAAPNDGEATTASGAPEALPGASTALRFGRLRLTNGYGYYTPLEMPVEAQYWSGKSWVLNTDDNCTAIAGGNLAVDQAGWTLTAAPGALDGGRSEIMLTRAADAARSARICVDLGADPATGVDCDAAASADLPWLQGKWPPGAGHDNDPFATATFGVFRQEGRKGIYNRELY